ncbi:MATE family efflux transporter [Rhodalgimonas zhirmunskyi]|uniref:Multidrug-efflux transporter n=1 Tax=Rhodalgimonas zhirmunskyi TaxID=2964767 RepID=A0AAJ1U950_9RHOB|nr:MATE family efflux transporter [Rhodoalgimonas zhirmunskyi]MDQ2093433.1 MATE family efflux transporter [Rhodoalgimonas zhirmunskyi]
MTRPFPPSAPAAVTRKEHLRAILKLGLPLIGGNVAQFAITLTDTIMLGWYDIDTLAGNVLGGMVFFVLFIFGAGFSLAVMPAVAEAEAAGDDTHVRRVTRMGLWASILFAAFALPVTLFAHPLLIAMGQEAQVAALASEYLAIAGWGIIFALIAMVLKSYLAALEHSGIVLWATLAAAGINVLADYALIFGHWGAPEMGIRGAAIASVTVQVVLCVVLAGYILVKTPQHDLFRRFWRPDPEAFGLVFRVGLPIGLTNLAEVSLFAASSVMMGWLGAVPLAAHGIALQISSLTFVVHMGLSSAATVRAGRALGRRDRDGLRRGAVVIVALSVGLAVLASAIFVIMPRGLVAPFLDPSNPESGAVLAMGALLLMPAALFQLFDAAQVMALGLLRGVQDTRVPLYIAAAAYWGVGMPASYGLGFIFGLGGVGVWLGLVLGLVVASALLIHRFFAISMERALPEG